MVDNNASSLCDATAHFIAGWLSGCGGVLASHPFDTVKVRLQTQGVFPTEHKYTGTWQCMKHTMYKEGFRGLFKGMSSPLLGTALWNAVVFGSYGNTINCLCGDEVSKQHEMKNVFLASMVAGVAQTFVICPLELTKSRLQIQSCQNSTKYVGLIDCIRQIHAQSGFRGLFNGYQGCFIRDMIGFPTYFCSFEVFMRMLSNDGPPYSDLGGFSIVIAGGFAGTFSWACAFPPDVIKCRIQVDYSGKYEGFVDCTKKSFQEEGMVLMKRGFIPTILRGFPMNAAIFSIYHMFMRSYDTWMHTEDN